MYDRTDRVGSLSRSCRWMPIEGQRNLSNRCATVGDLYSFRRAEAVHCILLVLNTLEGSTCSPARSGGFGRPFFVGILYRTVTAEATSVWEIVTL
jgi:hypothetical protein